MSALQLAFVITVVHGAETSKTSEAALFSWAAQSASYALEVSALSAEALRAMEEDLRGCKLDLNCISRRLRGQADAALLIILDNDDPQTLTTQLLRMDTRRIVSTAVDTVGERAPRELLQDQLFRVLKKAGHKMGGFVRLPSSPAGLRMSVKADQGQQTEVPQDSSGRVLLLPGDYEAELSHPDFETTRERFQVKAGAEVQLRAALRRPPPLYTQWWLWTGLAAVVAGASVGAYFAIRPTTFALRQEPGPGGARP